MDVEPCHRDYPHRYHTYRTENKAGEGRYWYCKGVKQEEPEIEVLHFGIGDTVVLQGNKYEVVLISETTNSYHVHLSDAKFTHRSHDVTIDIDKKEEAAWTSCRPGI